MNPHNYQLMRVEEQDGVPVVVVLCSELHTDTQIAKLEGEIEDYLQKSGTRQFVLDLTAVHFMASSGLRLLIVLRKRLRELGGRYTMCGVHRYVADVFRTTRVFSEKLDYLADLAAAAAALKEAPPQ